MLSEAIKLAMGKGGYQTPNVDVGNDGNLYTFGENLHNQELENRCALDPLFWKALSGALGLVDVHVNHHLSNGRCTELCFAPSIKLAHHYLDIKLTGGNEEEYWKGLLK